MTYPLARPDPLDRRFKKRVATRDRAVVRLTTGEIECVIRDRSDTGLRLLFKVPVTLETHFTITASSLKAGQGARLIWTDGFQAGVAFE